MMPISAFGPNQKILTHEHVYDLTKTVLNENFDGFEINGYKYTNNEVWNVLLYASANRLSIKGTASLSTMHLPTTGYIPSSKTRCFQRPRSMCWNNKPMPLSKPASPKG
jgi:hypothetical protein